METRIELKQGWKILQDVHDTGEKIGLYAAREADTSVGSQVSEWEELEELKHLQANPYTLRVTADSISYTLAFKEAFWALSLQGYTGTAAFRKLGYNTEVLGFERIHNTTKRIRREARSPEGFHEGARGGVRIPGGGNSQTEGASAPSDEAARRMKREILCLQQQMAFLKKVMRLHGKPGE